MKKTMTFLFFFLFTISCLNGYSQHSNKNVKDQIRLFDSLSNVYSQISIDTAIRFSKASLDISMKSNPNPELLYKMNLKIGILYRKKGDFSKALSSDINALKIAESLQDILKMGAANNSTGIDYYRMKDYEKALGYFNKALKYRANTGDSSGMGDTYYNIGMLYDDMGNTKLCRLYYLKALSIFENIGLTDGIADAYNGLAGMYYQLKKIDSVSFFAMKAFEIYEISGNKEMVAFMSINIANLYNMQKKYAEALTIINKGIKIAGEVGLISQLRQGYKALSETYSYMGDYKNAYLNYQTFMVFHDSVFTIEKARSMEELETKYQTEKKERQLIKKEAEIAIKNVLIDRGNFQRNMLIVLSALILIVLALIFWRYIDKKRMAVILNKQNEELKHTNATKDKFFSIISHDLRSPISSYQRLSSAIEQSIDKIDKETLKGYIAELNKSSKSIHGLLSNLLQWSMSQSGRLVPDKKIIDMQILVGKVIKDEEAGFNQKCLRVENIVQNDVKAFADPMMIETVIRNILSNAIKFSPEGSVISLETYSSGQRTFIKIKDSGAGISVEDMKKLFKIEEDVKKIAAGDPSKGAGLGLILCGELISLNNGKISVESPSEGGCIFTIELPISE